MKKGQKAYLISFKEVYGSTPTFVNLVECTILSVGSSAIKVETTEGKKHALDSHLKRKTEFSTEYVLFDSKEEADNYFTSLYDDAKVNLQIKKSGWDNVYKLPLELKFEIVRWMGEQNESK